MSELRWLALRVALRLARFAANGGGVVITFTDSVAEVE